jgi:isopentenyl diphosphate isomerase/L-lactate dehydrogenase-like FMN-dependent dehydrogenase
VIGFRRRVVNIEDLRRIAKRKLPAIAFDFIDGAAEDEVTLRANRRAFEEIAFRPRALVDTVDRPQSTTLLGTEIATPIVLAPTGYTRLASRNAEVEAARAAARAGTIYCLSTMASTSIEEVARAAEGPLWFQLYLWRHREISDSLVRRARDCGYQALVVTTDVPVASKRERDLHNGFVLPPRIRPGRAAEILLHPHWLWDLLTAPPITFTNLSEVGRSRKSHSDFVNRELSNPSASYDDLRRLRDEWQGSLLVKGTMTAEDAELAVASGVDGIVVGNHGGRQLDGLPASIEALPEVVEAVAGRADVLLESGIRRGSDVVKALALGARAVMIGRAYVYGLAAGGEEGAVKALEILSHEIDLCLALLGRKGIADLDESAVVLPASSATSATGLRPAER